MKQVTLITGASAGLGAEFARQCAARGDALALVARRKDRLEELKAELGGDVSIYAADLSLPGAPADLVARMEADGLAIGTLINNAGFGLSGRFDGQPEERQREMIALNIGALTELCRAVLPQMLARGDGAILNVASTAAFQPGPFMAIYYASKSYVLSLTEALHEELKGTKIKVSAICPGPTKTEFFEVANVTGLLPRIATDPVGVVRAGLKGLERNKAVIIRGLGNKTTSKAYRFLPRVTMRRIMARLKQE